MMPALTQKFEFWAVRVDFEFDAPEVITDGYGRPKLYYHESDAKDSANNSGKAWPGHEYTVVRVEVIVGQCRP